MVERVRAVQRILRLDKGSYTIEGLVAMVVFFILLVLIVQVAFLVASRSMIGAAVDGSTRRLSHGSGVDGELNRLESEIAAVIPGVHVEEIDIGLTDEMVRVSVRYRWIPPGPDLIQVSMGVDRAAFLSVPP